MNALKGLVAALLAICFFSVPAWGQKVMTDYDHSVNFSKYHTYCWGHVHASDPLFEPRIQQAVDHALESKGWQKVQDNCDTTVTAVLVQKNHPEYTTFYDGLGPGWGWHGWGGMGLATTTVEKVPLGTLIVDIYDTQSEHLIWRGEAGDQLSEKPDKDTKKLEKAVDKMFAKFPPVSV